MAFIEPLQLYEILVEKLAGNFSIFLLLSLFVIAVMGAAFRMSGMLLLAMVGLFILLLSGSATDFAGSEASMMLAILGTLVVIALAYYLNQIFGR